MRFTTLLSVAAVAVVTAAQNVTFNYATLTYDVYKAAMPQCVRSCVDDSLLTDGCHRDDFACHCRRTDYVGARIQPCLATKSNCTQADIGNFVSIVTPTCAYFNSTQSITSSQPTPAQPTYACNSTSTYTVTVTQTGMPPLGKAVVTTSSNYSAAPPIATFTGAAVAFPSAVGKVAGSLAIAAGFLTFF